MMYLMDFKSAFQNIPGEIYSSLAVFVIIFILCLIVKIKCKHVDPLAKPKGLIAVMEIAVEKCDKFVETNMGKIFVKRMGPYMGFCFIYIFLAFTIGLFAAPSPMTYYMVPFSLALITFMMIHITSIKYTKWKYFKRYVEPFPVFLPINLVSMWAPLISLSFRLFGNACSGWVLMKLVYGVFTILSEKLFAGLQLPIAVLITPVLHAYFDLFSGFIQTLIFAYLTTLLVASEVPETIDVNDLELAMK